LSLVIPAYNEAANLRAGVLTHVASFLRTTGTSFEILVVDDGSGDETARLIGDVAASDPTVRLLRTHHGGKAHALVHGMQAATGRIVLFADMDQATPIDEVSKLLPWFDKGFDIVIGSRGLERQHAPFSRRLISFGQLLARYAVLRFSDIVDTQCGFKAFRREVVGPLIDRLVVYRDAIEERPSGPRLSPGFDVELLFAATALGLSIKEVPVRWDHRRGRQTKLIRDCVRGLFDLWAIRAAARQGRYEPGASARRGGTP
jgi:dolichyl-phosphate beta-glucosyltransferase